MTAVRDALKHPLIQRAAKAQALRRETPLQRYREDGTLIERVADVAFQESSPEFKGWTVVDFKTDLEIEKAALKLQSVSKPSESQLHYRPAVSCSSSRKAEDAFF